MTHSTRAAFFFHCVGWYDQDRIADWGDSDYHQWCDFDAKLDDGEREHFHGWISGVDAFDF